MKVLVLGGSGATGRLLLQELLQRNIQVKTIVRSAARLPETIRTHKNIEIIEKSVLDTSAAEKQALVQDCNAVTCCLGHVPNFRGIWGKPHRLVTEVTQQFCEAIRSNQPQQPIKFVLMNTTGNRNPDTDPPRTFGEKVVIALLRILLPPHPDNEQAAKYLRIQLDEDDYIEWTAVRPDGLIDEEIVTEYAIYPAVQRSPIFNAGKTSRINVAHFMAELVTNNVLWQQWQGKMPVIYNKTSVDELKATTRL